VLLGDHQLKYSTQIWMASVTFLVMGKDATDGEVIVYAYSVVVAT
jgi:hypothetical protein